MSFIDKLILALLVSPFLALAAAFAVEAILDRWHAPESPHSGFCPDFPTCDPSDVELPPEN